MSFNIEGFLASWGKDMPCNFSPPYPFLPLFTNVCQAKDSLEIYNNLLRFFDVAGQVSCHDICITAQQVARTVVAVTNGDPKLAHHWLDLLATPFLVQGSTIHYRKRSIAFGVVLGLFQAVVMLDEKDSAQETVFQTEFPEKMAEIVSTQLHPSDEYPHLGLSAQELRRFHPNDGYKGKELEVALSQSVKAYVGGSPENRGKRLAQAQRMVGKILGHIPAGGIPDEVGTSWVGPEILENLSYGLFSLLKPNGRLTTIHQFLVSLSTT